MEYRKYLEATAEYYNVSPETILNTNIRKLKIVYIRQLFYRVCFKNHIDIYQLALALGRDRNSCWKSMKNKEGNKEIEQKIKEIANAKR